jgi:hypothetical protein
LIRDELLQQPAYTQSKIIGRDEKEAFAITQKINQVERLSFNT